MGGRLLRLQVLADHAFAMKIQGPQGYQW